MATQLEQWFRLADEDRDGWIGGGEAVKFFTKSGLPQEVLGQVHSLLVWKSVFGRYPEQRWNCAVPSVHPASNLHQFTCPDFTLEWFAINLDLYCSLYADLGGCIWWWPQTQPDAVQHGPQACVTGSGTILH